MKLFFALAVRNLFRNRLRTAVSLLSIAFGCAALIVNSGIVFNIFRELREDAIHGRHGHLQIYRRGYSDGHMMDPERYMIAQSEADQIIRIAQRDPRVMRATRRREFTGLASNGGRQAPFIGIGVEAADDYEFSKHTTLVAGSQLSSKTGYGILAGKGLAEKLKQGPAFFDATGLSVEVSGITPEPSGRRRSRRTSSRTAAAPGDGRGSQDNPFPQPKRETHVRTTHQRTSRQTRGRTHRRGRRRRRSADAPGLGATNR